MNPATIAAAGESGAGLLQVELTVVVLLVIAALVAIFAKARPRLPYTVALVLAGLALAFLPRDLVSLGDNVGDIILLILVPPLVFEATLHIKWSALRQNLSLILLVAGAGSLIGAGLVGLFINLTTELTLIAALTFGVLISATDPVAVIAFFRTLGVDKRLALLVEGESLFNDGVAIVLFSVALGVAQATASGAAQAVGVLDVLLEFIEVAGGGLLIGVVLGYVVSHIVLKNVDDHLIETTWTVALAFGAFVLAEEFHLSGILAVVAAGIFVGNVGTQNTSPTTAITLNNFWEFLAFVANSLVFLIIGLDTEIRELFDNLPKIIIAVVVVLLSRAVVVYGLAWLHNRLRPRLHVSPAFQHIMWWGGLRGAVSLALALKLTGSNAFAPDVSRTIQAMTYGVVLFTLLGQATSLPALLKRLGLTQKPAYRLAQQRMQAWLFVHHAGRGALRQLEREGILAESVWEAMDEVYAQDVDEERRALQTHLQEYAELKQEMVFQGREVALQAERSALSEALRRGLVSDDLYDELARALDRRLAALDMIKRMSVGPAQEEAE